MCIAGCDASARVRGVLMRGSADSAIESLGIFAAQHTAADQLGNKKIFVLVSLALLRDPHVDAHSSGHFNAHENRNPGKREARTGVICKHSWGETRTLDLTIMSRAL